VLAPLNSTGANTNPGHDVSSLSKILLEDIEKYLSKHGRKIKLIRRDKEDGRIMIKRQPTCKWIDNKWSYKMENQTAIIDIIQ